MTEVLNPSNYSFSLYSIPTLLTAVGILLLGLLVLFRERLTLVSMSFLLVTLSVFIWLFAFSWLYSSTNPYVADWWSRVAYLGVPFIAPATYQFTVVVLRRYRRYDKLVWLAWAITALFTLLAVRTDTVIDGVYHYWWGFYTRYGSLGMPFVVFFCGLLIMSMCHYWLEDKLAPPGIHRRRIRSFMLAFAIGYIGAVDFIPAYGITINPFGYLCILGFLVIAARFGSAASRRTGDENHDQKEKQPARHEYCFPPAVRQSGTRRRSKKNRAFAEIFWPFCKIFGVEDVTGRITLRIQWLPGPYFDYSLPRAPWCFWQVAPNTQPRRPR